MKMNDAQRIRALLNADPEKLAAVDAILAGEGTPSRPASMRLLLPHEAAKLLGVSRVTIWRAMKEGRLRVVRVRPGSWGRIPEADLLALIERKDAVERGATP